MANILDTIPKNLSLRFKQLFEAFEELYNEKITGILDEDGSVRHIYDTEYELDEEIVEMLFDLFGFKVSDLKYFADADRKTIKNLFADNIFAFYQGRLTKGIYTQLLYMYKVRGEVYPLDTLNWDYFYRTEIEYLDVKKYMDIGLTMDAGLDADGNPIVGESSYEMDNLYRTSFIEIEIFLDQQIETGKLWTSDIDSSIKGDVENIRYILSKPFYTLFCDVAATENDTNNNANGVTAVSIAIPNLDSLDKYKIVYTDATFDIFYINTKDEDVDNYYVNFENTFGANKIIKTIYIMDINDSINYVTITFPDIYLAVNDKLRINITIDKNP